MKLELLDSLSIAGNPDKPNDDAFAHGDTAAVVFDGATGIGEQLMPGPSDAAWLAKFGARRVMAHLRDGDAPKDAVRAAMADAERSYKALRRRAPEENYEIPFASMMLANVSGNGIDALWFGDCAAFVKRPEEPVEIVGDAFDKRALEASRVGKLAARHGLSPAAGANRPEFLAALRKARNYANTEKGHWTFAPDPRAAQHVAEKHIAASAGTALLLCTDGFLALASDYGKYDPESLVAAARAKGLQTLAGELRAIERDDPEGKKFPRFKTSDDATAMLLASRSS